MICSVPLTRRGYAYFETAAPPRPRLVSLSKDSFGVPLEDATPLLPLDAIPQSTGEVAIGVICYCQNTQQLEQIRRLPPIKPLIKTPEKETQQPEYNLFDSLLRALITALIVRGLLK